MSRSSWGWVIGVVAVIAVAAALAVRFGVPGLTKADAVGMRKDGKPDVTLEFTPREVVQPTLASIPKVVPFSGPLVAPQTAVVRAKASGTLLELHVGEGSRVRAGQTLGRIDVAEMSNRAAERQAMLESARATLTQAERTHASNQRLAEQQFISPNALENSQAALDAARAQMRAATASLDAVRMGLRESALLAPIGGIVAKRQALPGEKLAIEQPVLTIVDLGRLELAGAVGTHEVARLATGMTVQVQVEGLAQPVAGRLVRIAPAAEPGTRSIGVTIEIPNPEEKLRAGQYALASVVLADDAQRLTVPATAIATAAGQDHVWVIDGGLLKRRAVTTGRRDEREGRVEVLQGLDGAAQVLASRFDELREGTRAVVVARKVAPVASASMPAPAR